MSPITQGCRFLDETRRMALKRERVDREETDQAEKERLEALGCLP
jgi:hypothetical protein